MDYTFVRTYISFCNHSLVIFEDHMFKIGTDILKLFSQKLIRSSHYIADHTSTKCNQILMETFQTH